MAESKSIPNIAERWIDLYKFLRTAQEVTPDDGNSDPFEKCKAAYRAWRESGAGAVDMRAVAEELRKAFSNIQVVNTGPTPDQEQEIWDAAQNAGERLKIATYEVFMRMGRWDRLTKEHVSRVQRQWNAGLLTRRRFQKSHWERRKNPVNDEHVKTMKVVDHPVASLCVGHVVQGPAANDDRVLELLPGNLTITIYKTDKQFTYNPLMHVLRTLYMEFRLHTLHSQINKGRKDVGTRVFWVRLLGAMYKDKKIESSETKVVFSNDNREKPIYAVPPYIVVHQVGLKIKDEDEYEWVLSQLFKPLEMPGVGQSPGGKSGT